MKSIIQKFIYYKDDIIVLKCCIFFMYMILMGSKAQLAMNLGETYLVTETGNERLGKQKLNLVVL